MWKHKDRVIIPAETDKFNCTVQNKVPSALSTPLPLTHEGFWGFPLSLFVVKYSYV